MRTKNHSAKDILNQIHDLVAEAEEKIVDTSSDALDGLRDRVEAVQERAGEIYHDARKRVVAGAKATDATIRENPYSSLAVAAGVGLAVGYVLGRRKR